ncbi:MAG: AAA family ATPase, partial [Acidimicrobiales bacterium]
MAVDESEIDEFAALFRRFLERMARPAGEGPTLAERLADHLGVDPIGLSSIAESFDSWEHANVQAALDAYLNQPGHEGQLVGILGGQKRAFGIGLSDLLVTRAMSVAGMPSTGAGSGPVDFVNLAAGPGRTLACIQFGVALVSGTEGRLAVLVRSADERSGPMSARVTVEVMAPEQAQASAFLARLRRLMVEHNVYRGQVVSLARRQPPYGTIVVEFRPRPEVRRSDIVLGDGVLERIESHVVGIGAEAARLLAAGRHLKRGLLLHGPPGTGKTLTVRYLSNRLADATVLVLSGPALSLVGPTCALARTLSPAVVVLEDVDLVAEERTMPGMGRNPLLFELLNEMEGMAEDADVTFLLTTNRPDILEPALAARPGRIDLAVEIELPDDEGRRRLFDLYGSGLDL